VTQGVDVERYTVISSDCHGGADLRDYKPFLEARYHDAFDAWADAWVNPFGDLVRADADRNWDSTKRQPALEADGVVGEVVYPNTVPPFFSMGLLISRVPTAEEFELRLAGLRAHNRWLAQWCAELPERRAGVGQILLNDVDEAVRDVHWIADHGLRGGVLVPGVPPGSGIDPHHSPRYDPIWRACEERDVVVAVHGGGGSPDHGMHPASLSMFILEAAFYSHRPLWSLVISGVFDRFPGLRLVLAESGAGWVPRTLDAMDRMYAKISRGNVGELPFLAPFLLDRMPSEYWHTNCWVGASFMTREDCLDREAIGVDRIMWGSDFPHAEGTAPFSAEAIAHTFAGVDPVDVRRMLGGTAAAVYGFDLDVLDPIAAQVGPRVDDVLAGIDAIPGGSVSLAFESRVTGVG
jgi:predicted TIM-barrel fold metal-dependent hydrolase